METRILEKEKIGRWGDKKPGAVWKEVRNRQRLTVRTIGANRRVETIRCPQGAGEKKRARGKETKKGRGGKSWGGENGVRNL